MQHGRHTGRKGQERMKAKRIILAVDLLAIWLVLLMGCTASQQLDQACGAEQWSSVQLVERYDRTGEEAVPLSPDAVSPEALRALLHEAYAKPAYASAQLPVPCIQLFLSCEDGTLCTLAVGANGRVVLSAHSEGSETASYWNTGSSALYDALLAIIN